VAESDVVDVEEHLVGALSVPRLPAGRPRSPLDPSRCGCWTFAAADGSDNLLLRYALVNRTG
jgi:hypothetical protein